MKLTEATRRQFVPELPEAYDIKDLRVLHCSAKLQPHNKLDAEESAVVANLKEAGPPLIDESGKPTILKVVAWMAHGNVINRNRDMFIKEELEAIAPTLFTAPNFGALDFDHSAVRPWSEDPKVLGVWYRTEYAFDQKADNGKGAWGILATGMMFAWAYPEFATTLLGEQARDDKVSFSMACIPGGTEFRTDEDGSYAVLHNPIFFTLSALDVPPADPDALGNVSEDPNVSNDQLRELVTSADKGARMDKELQAKLEADKAEALAKVEALQAMVTKHEAAEARVVELESKIAELSTLPAKVAELDTRVAELDLARDAAVKELETAKVRIVELETANIELTAKVAEYEAKAAAQTRQETLVARLAQLPKDFVELHASKDEEIRSKLEAKWVAMDDTAWIEYMQHELLGYIPGQHKVGFVRRSEAEGALRAAGSSEHGIAAMIASVKK